MDIIGTSFMLIVAESGKVNLVTCFFCIVILFIECWKGGSSPTKSKVREEEAST